MGKDGVAYERFSQQVDGPMTIIAIAWLPVLVIPLVTKTSGALDSALTAIDYTVWALFTVEYIIKLYLAPSRWRFIRTHLIDLMVIVVPFLRPLRAARLIRVFRLSRVVVVLGGLLKRARSVLTHHGLHFVLLAVVIILFVGAAAELGFEHNAKGANIHNYPDALWWVVVTVTTVGYGDKYPVTAGGRGVATVIMFVGIGLVGVITATVASYFIETSNREEDARLARMEVRLERMEQLLHAAIAQQVETPAEQPAPALVSAETSRGSPGMRISHAATPTTDL